MYAKEARHIANHIITLREQARQETLLSKFKNCIDSIEKEAQNGGIFCKFYILSKDFKDFEWLFKRLGYDISVINSSPIAPENVDIRW